MKRKIIITLLIILFVLLGVFGYFYYQTGKEDGNLQYVQTETGEQILMPKTWKFTTGNEAGKALNITTNKNIQPVFFATQKQKNSKVFYYIIKEKLNRKLSTDMIKDILKSTVDSERKNGTKIKIIDKGLINSKSKNQGQFIIYKVGNIYKFIAYFYNKESELTTFTSYLNEDIYEQHISLIKYIALKNKY